MSFARKKLTKQYLKHETKMHIPPLEVPPCLSPLCTHSCLMRTPGNVLTLSQALDMYANTHAVHVITSHDQQGVNNSMVCGCDVELGFPSTHWMMVKERERARESESEREE